MMCAQDASGFVSDITQKCAYAGVMVLPRSHVQKTCLVECLIDIGAGKVLFSVLEAGIPVWEIVSNFRVLTPLAHERAMMASDLAHRVRVGHSGNTP